MSLWSSVRRLLGLRESAAAGQRTISYRPRHNRQADPGEVVWASVDFDDGSGRKDRPVLIVGRQGRRTVLGLMLSTQEKRERQSAWLPIGAGAWDKLNRPSYVRLDRVLELDPARIRREGSVLDRQRSEYVAHALRTRHGWR